MIHRPPRTRPRTASLLLVLAAGATLLTTGCASAVTADATAAAQRFEQALGQDPAAACSTLAPGTRDALESDTGSPCGQALPEAGLPRGGDVVRAEVNGHSAQVVLAKDVLFLALFDDGWKVTAAGCTDPGADPQQPYDCLIKGD